MNFQIKATTLLSSAALAAVSLSARADAPKISVGPAAAPAIAPKPDAIRSSFFKKAVRKTVNDSFCGPFDPDCSRRISRILSSVHLFTFQTGAGVAGIGTGNAQPVVNFTFQGLSVDAPMGEGAALLFDAVAVPEQGGFRLRFTLADSEVLFFCTNSDNQTLPPLSGLSEYCREDATFGVGGTLAQVQWDTATSRWAVRWAELNAVYNFLANGNGFTYLNKRLNGHAGASLDTIWVGETPNAGGSTTVVRGNVGVSGMLRSDNNRWEIRGLAGYRPNVAQWDDYSIEARTQILHHLLLSPTSLANLGIEAQYQRNSLPARSFGPWASDRERDSLYLGAMFGIVTNE